MNKKILSYLGFCRKAGKLVTGEESCEKAIAAGSAVLIIVSEDASENTKKKFKNKAEFYNAPLAIWGGRDDLSSAIGQINRPTMVITDKGLGEKIKEILLMENVPLL